jgi:hypothetical protein
MSKKNDPKKSAKKPAPVAKAKAKPAPKPAAKAAPAKGKTAAPVKAAKGGKVIAAPVAKGRAVKAAPAAPDPAPPPEGLGVVGREPRPAAFSSAAFSLLFAFLVTDEPALPGCAAPSGAGIAGNMG